MTFNPANTRAPFLPTSTVWSEEESQRLITMTSRDTDIANAVNLREISTYPLIEVLTGQQWFDPATTLKTRFGFRKVFSFGAIIAGATLTFAHGIVGIITLTHIYGGIKTNLAPNFSPLPRVSATLITDQVSVDMIGANIVIVNGATAPAIISGVIVAEYLLN